MRFPCAWSGPVAVFLQLDARQSPLVGLLQDALARAAGARWVVLDWRLLRLGRSVDAVVATDRAVVAIRFRPHARAFAAADRLAAEDAALDLADFHAGSRGRPILPVLLIPTAPGRARNIRCRWPAPRPRSRRRA